MGLSEFVGNVCTVGVHVLISRPASLTAHGADRLNPLVLNLNSTDHVETGTCGMCVSGGARDHYRSVGCAEHIA